MTLAGLKRWVADPTTIAGIASAAASAIVSYYGGAPWPVDVAGFVASAVLLIMPGNTATAADVRQAFLDGVTVATSKGGAGIGALAGDVVRVASDLHPDTPAVPLAPAAKAVGG